MSLFALPSLRTAYRTLWSCYLTNDWLQWGVTLKEVFRLEIEVGEPKSTEAMREEAAAFHKVHGICPLCGEVGELHLPKGEI